MTRLLTFFFRVTAAQAASANWDHTLGDKAGSHYSTLREITPENAGRPEFAWTYRVGGTHGENRTQIQCNPLVRCSLFQPSTFTFQRQRRPAERVRLSLP